MAATVYQKFRPYTLLLGLVLGARRNDWVACLCMIILELTSRRILMNVTRFRLLFVCRWNQR